MRCMVCGGWFLSHICAPCRKTHLAPSLHTRKILGNIPVYSFYRYDEIEPLLLSKHTDTGYYVYSILAHEAMRRFAENFAYERPVAAVGIDDHVRHGYSHTAVLVKALQSGNIIPHYGRLRAHSRKSYSGQSYQYRLLNPRRFVYRPFAQEEAILVDDIMTTGLTLTQAAETLHREGKKVLFCLTLADADRK